MYTDMYQTFYDECIPYSYPFSFQDHKLNYMRGEEPTYEMDYGDTVTIPFHIDEKYQEYYINVILYNFRYEEIYGIQDKVDDCGNVYLVIDHETSEKLLKRGRYYCRVQAMFNNGYYEDVSTLINPTECVIRVR